MILAEEAHQSEVRGIRKVHRPDSRSLTYLSASMDGTLLMWSIVTPTTPTTSHIDLLTYSSVANVPVYSFHYLHSFRAHSAPLSCLGYDGESICSGDILGCAMLWQFQQGTQFQKHALSLCLTPPLNIYITSLLYPFL